MDEQKEIGMVYKLFERGDFLKVYINPEAVDNT